MPNSAKTPKELFRFNVGDNGIIEIEPYEDLVPEMSQTIVRRVNEHIRQHGTPTGFLIDMRRTLPLSIVRISGLIDSLSVFKARVAVVFPSTQQQKLAQLLHHTLQHRDTVAYFTRVPDAWDYLLANKDKS